MIGKDAKGFSTSTVTRLKNVWAKEYDEWQGRSLEGKRYFYWRADVIHFNVRYGEDSRMCMLVIIGATPEGRKELIVVAPGYREYTMS